MCRMLGIYTSKYNEQISALLKRDFLKLSKNGNVKPGWQEGHTDGWGIAGYLGDKWATHFGRSHTGAIAEVENFVSSSEKALNSNSRFLIAHLRKATPGFIPRVTNSHPFISRGWIFAHNGAIAKYRSELILPDGIQPSGDTDSEKFFLYIKEKIIHAPSAQLPEILKSQLDDLSSTTQLKFTSLTFLLTNNEWLIGYRRYSESPDYYTLYFSADPDDKTALFCSQPIGKYNWQLMKNGDLIAIDRNGSIKNLS